MYIDTCMYIYTVIRMVHMVARLEKQKNESQRGEGETHSEKERTSAERLERWIKVTKYIK